MSRSIDSDEEAASDKQASTEANNPSRSLLDVGNKPDLCLLSLALIDHDHGCNRTPGVTAGQDHNALSSNNVANSNHISSMNSINNNNNKTPGVGRWRFLNKIKSITGSLSKVWLIEKSRNSFHLCVFALSFSTQMLQSRRRKILDLYTKACNVTEGKTQKENPIPVKRDPPLPSAVSFAFVCPG